MVWCGASDLTSDDQRKAIEKRGNEKKRKGGIDKAKSGNERR